MATASLVCGQIRFGLTYSVGGACAYSSDDAALVDENHMGGPHVSGSPVLWADGAVRIYTYGYVCCGILPATVAEAADTAVWQELWSYNRIESVQPPP